MFKLLNVEIKDDVAINSLQKEGYESFKRVLPVIEGERLHEIGVNYRNTYRALRSGSMSA